MIVRRTYLTFIVCWRVGTLNMCMYMFLFMSAGVIVGFSTDFDPFSNVHVYIIQPLNYKSPIQGNMSAELRSAT
jgi:hypothetical protein